MANRGMLPKFRPAALGREAVARPSIRPVKPVPPPPPPAPPRRMPSGISRRQSEEPLPFDLRARDDHDPPTSPFSDPPTMAAPRGRANVVAISFDDETQARPVDDHLIAVSRDEPAGPRTIPYGGGMTEPPPAPQLDVPYESLPSLEVRRPFDTYEAEFAERDPVTQLHGARESIRRMQVEPAPRTQRLPPSDEDSGPRPRLGYDGGASAYAAPIPSYDEDPSWPEDP